MKFDINKFIILVNITVVAMFTFCTILLFAATNKQEVVINNFNDGWYLNNEPVNSLDNKIETNVKEHNEYTFSHVITKDMAGYFLHFKSTNQYVNVFIDNKLVYKVDIPIKTNLVNTPASSYNYIKIPIDSIGKKIEIQIREHYNDFSNKTISFTLGEKTDIEGEYLRNVLPNTFISAMLLVIGIILIIISAVFKDQVDTTKKTFLLGMFSFSFAIWSLSETYVLYWLVKNPIAIYFLRYGSLFIIPIYFILFTRQELFKIPAYKNKVKILDGLSIFHTLLIILIYALQLLKILDFKFTRTFYHIGLAIELIVLIYIESTKSKKSNSIRKILSSMPFVILVMSICFDIGLFYLEGIKSGWGCRLWIFFYITITVKNTIADALTKALEGAEAKHLKEIAYTDTLTGINNRNAFVSNLANTNIQKTTILSFDVNNLKYYNDNYGHDKGDELLISMANTLKKVFKNSAYRMGGDEFIVLLDTIDNKKIEELIKQFESEVIDFNNSNDKIILQSAYGYSAYSEGKTYDDMIKEADKNMYICKKKQKTT